MPTYDYRCTDCGHTCEISQPITEKPLEQCPHCSKLSLKRGIGGGFATFQFKGEGFYLTDYKKGCGKSSCDCKTNNDS